MSLKDRLGSTPSKWPNSMDSRWGVTAPQKFNIDTKNGHMFKRNHLFHSFGYPAVRFRGLLTTCETWAPKPPSGTPKDPCQLYDDLRGSWRRWLLNGTHLCYGALACLLSLSAWIRRHTFPTKNEHENGKKQKMNEDVCFQIKQDGNHEPECSHV